MQEAQIQEAQLPLTLESIYNLVIQTRSEMQQNNADIQK